MPGITPKQAVKLMGRKRKVSHVVIPDTAPDSIATTLPYPPSSNRYWRHFRGRTVRSSQAMAYIRAVRTSLTANGYTNPIPVPVAITYRVYRPIKAGDLMNREKVLSDALQGLAIVDDKQIREAHLYLDDDKDNPRVEIEIRRIK